MEIQASHHQPSIILDRRAFLVSVNLPDRRPDSSVSLPELRQLAETAGAEVVGETTQHRIAPDPSMLIGHGKAGELLHAAASLHAEVILFDNNLSPAQVRNLEKKLALPVMDRTELILDIFSMHARSRQAKLQVALAKSEYALPRLKRLWTHLSRIEKGIRAGVGEKQIELDRRLLRKRITSLRRSLQQIEKRRALSSMKRSSAFTICLVGYTNAGKTTLLNSLCGADENTQDTLFVTLDTRTRRWTMDRRHEVLLSDTVGFISHLPHNLVESFHSTLQEARQADLLLHVMDASSPDRDMHYETVRHTLEGIGCGDIPVMLVLNKIDRVRDPADYALLQARYAGGVAISAMHHTGMDRLAQKILEQIERKDLLLRITAPYSNGKLLAFLSAHGKILKSMDHGDGKDMEIRIQQKFLKQLRMLAKAES